MRNFFPRNGGLKFWGMAHLRHRPLPAPPGTKFSGEFSGPPKVYQLPLELGQKLHPVSSYSGLNISKIDNLGANISTTPDPNFKIILAVDRGSTA